MAESTWADPNFQSWAKDRYILAKACLDDLPEFRKRFNIIGTPTVLLMKAGGEEIDRIMGYTRATEFISTIEGYHKGIGTLAALLAEEPQKTKDPKFIYLLGGRLMAHNRLDDADARFAAVVALDSTNTGGDADDAILDRAWISRKQENWKQAVTHCRDLLRRWPDGEMADDATIYIGWYASKGGQKDEALAAFREYLSKWPAGEDTTFAREQIAELLKPPPPDSGTAK